MYFIIFMCYFIVQKTLAFENGCSRKSTNFTEVSIWSRNALYQEDQERINYLMEPPNFKEIYEFIDRFHEVSAKIINGACNIFKKFGGTWMNWCAFNDGEKLVCMEHLYRAIKSDDCLVYSFGLKDDWEFEVMMAELGKFNFYIKLFEDKQMEF